MAVYDKDTAKAILRQFDPDVEYYSDNASDNIAGTLATIALLAEIRDILREQTEDRIDEGINKYIEENR